MKPSSRYFFAFSIALFTNILLWGNFTAAKAANDEAPTPQVVPPQQPFQQDDPASPQNETIILGETVSGRPIEAFKFGSGPDAMILVGGTHAGFAPSSADIARAAQQALNNLGDQLPENLTVYVIPSLNPDSPYNPGEFAGRLNANGVDLNRNADCRWSADGSWGGNVVPGMGGSEPFSEPESRAFRDFVLEVRPVATIFWEARARDGLVVPGNCGQRLPEAELLNELYAAGSGYRKPDNYASGSTDVLQGDLTNWLAQEGLPAIAVLLPSYTEVDWAANRRALTAVINHYGDGEIVETAFYTQEPAADLLKRLVGQWEGTLVFASEYPPALEFEVQLDLRQGCVSGDYCLVSIGPEPPHLRGIEMQAIPEGSNFAWGPGACFGTFFDGNEYPITILCLNETFPDAVEVQGTEPVTGIRGNLSRQAFDCARLTVSAAECGALVALYQSTNGAEWTNSDGWLVSSDPCTWHGINCQGMSGNLSHIILENNNLTGVLPPELGTLNLNWFSVADNPIGGPLPPEMGQMGVANLVLRNTKIEGPLPLTFTTIRDLQVFDFANTAICFPEDPAIDSWLTSGPLILSPELSCGDAVIDQELIALLREQLAEKKRLIEYLENPIARDEGSLLLQHLYNAAIPSVGYDEERAKEMVARIEGNLPWYEDGLMEEEAMAAFEQEAESFGRLLLVERSAEAFYPLYFSTSEDIAEATLGVLSIAVGMNDVLNSVEQYDLTNPFSEISLKWKRRAYTKVLKSVNSIWESMLNTVENKNLRDDLQQLRQSIFYVIEFELDNGAALTDIFYDQGLRRAIAFFLTQSIVEQSQPLITMAADSVPHGNSAGLFPNGDYSFAEGYNELLNNEVARETERVHGVHENFQEFADVADAVADVSELVKASGAGTFGYIAGTALNGFSQGYTGYCGITHYKYLSDAFQTAQERAFMIEGYFLNDLPEADHCRPFEWFSDRGVDDMVMVAAPYDGWTAVPSQAEQTEVELVLAPDFIQALEGYQQALSQVVANAEGQPEPLIAALEQLLAADARLQTYMRQTLQSVVPDELAAADAQTLYRDLVELDSQMLSLAVDLALMLGEPDRLSAAILRDYEAQIGSAISNLTASIEAVEDASDVQIVSSAAIPAILDVTLPLQAEVNQPFSIEAVLINEGEIEGSALELIWSVFDDAGKLLEGAAPRGAQLHSWSYQPQDSGQLRIHLDLAVDGTVVDQYETAIDIIPAAAEGEVAAAVETDGAADAPQNEMGDMPADQENEAEDEGRLPQFWLWGALGGLAVLAGGGWLWLRGKAARR